MKLTVLVDNNSLLDRYFLAEPGLSFYLEESHKKILFDTGYSNIFLTNGDKIGIDFFDIDYIVISHSHLDHTWGLESYIKRLTGEIMEGRSFKRSTIIGHPQIFNSKSLTGIEEIGMHLDEKKLLRYFENGLSKEPVWITQSLVFLGEIPRKNTFESMKPIGKVLIDGRYEDDYNSDDSALCYKSHKGLVIITGCSHSGICNIIEYAKKVCNEERIVDVIGGFHLQKPTQNQMDRTVDYFEQLGVDKIHACHCTDLASKIALSRVVKIGEVGSGLTLEF